MLVRNVSRDTDLMTDESRLYTGTGKEYASHETVKHTAGEYVRGGVYQHCGEAHLFRYLAEFEFRHNRRAGLKISDSERHDQVLAKIEDKRLTYRRIGEAALA